ncbi:MAG: GvpL/GvpF family gas vesicle protein [Marinifilaceae bacterium]|jgi:demethoxyubiquinone hydroxylase (CLK1/Coq7/Cat5 family)
MDRIKCVYAIVCSDEPENSTPVPHNLIIKGLNEANTYAVSHNRISAIVSDMERNGSSLDKNSALKFAGVIEELALHYCVLPMRFGTFFESKEAVQEMLEKHYEKFCQCLSNVNRKYEFCLKVFWNANRYHSKVRTDSVTTEMEARSILSGTSLQTNYLLNKLKEHKQEEKLLNYVESLIDEIGQRLKHLNPLVKSKKMVSKSLILDAVYLLDKKYKEAFIHEIDSFNKRHDDLNLLLTGPWPPYSFADINAK